MTHCTERYPAAPAHNAAGEDQKGTLKEGSA